MSESLARALSDIDRPRTRGALAGTSTRPGATCASPHDSTWPKRPAGSLDWLQRGALPRTAPRIQPCARRSSTPTCAPIARGGRRAPRSELQERLRLRSSPRAARGTRRGQEARRASAPALLAQAADGTATAASSSGPLRRSSATAAALAAAMSFTVPVERRLELAPSPRRRRPGCGARPLPAASSRPRLRERRDRESTATPSAICARCTRPRRPRPRDERVAFARARATSRTRTPRPLHDLRQKELGWSGGPGRLPPPGRCVWLVGRDRAAGVGLEKVSRSGGADVAIMERLLSPWAEQHEVVELFAA